MGERGGEEVKGKLWEALRDLMVGVGLSAEEEAEDGAGGSVLEFDEGVGRLHRKKSAGAEIAQDLGVAPVVGGDGEGEVGGETLVMPPGGEAALAGHGVAAEIGEAVADVADEAGGKVALGEGGIVAGIAEGVVAGRAEHEAAFGVEAEVGAEVPTGEKREVEAGFEEGTEAAVETGVDGEVGEERDVGG